MREITVYRTTSYGGTEGRTLETRTFETIELAKADALADTWNDGFTLYKVVITFDGVVTEEETLIGDIRYGQDIKRLVYEQKCIENAKKRIEEHKANKRIKEATRNKRIADEMKRIEWSTKVIKNIERKG